MFPVVEADEYIKAEDASEGYLSNSVSTGEEREMFYDDEEIQNRTKTDGEMKAEARDLPQIDTAAVTNRVRNVTNSKRK